MGIYSKPKPPYTALLNSENLSGYRIGIQFHKSVFFAEQNNYAINIVNT